ncbi:MotA/TolQ/ExbB proton channel family protein [Ideonella livida]|uniref:DUF2341 domain-containing protein n=1 Tax=Ideonella livida TaxID=2707176 RepID=A0A7C9PKG5_9BURK|nr:MotA/TolQ/ExbB proton channel family protein [Ideonella livida]NDY94049.1 DUF2341 domain-containing protein [Ideonella livida]
MNLRKLFLGLAAACALAAPAHAWWQDAWTTRARIVLDTRDQGLKLPAAVQDVVVPVRLHTGNFDFTAAQPDGSDLRVIGADDKTPLPFEIERFDPINELAVLWVRLPVVEAGSDKNLLHVYACNAQAPQETRAPVFAEGFAAVLHFDEASGPVTDRAHGATATLVLGEPKREAAGLLGGAWRSDGTLLSLPVAGKQIAGGGDFTLALWVKPEDETADATLAALGPLRLQRSGGQLQLQAGAARVGPAALPAGAWAHVVLSVQAGQATLSLNGQAVGQAAAPSLGAVTALELGRGFKGLMDEVQLLTRAEGPAWTVLGHAAQGLDGGLVRASRDQVGQPEEGGEPGYMGVLVKNLTVDAWVVIVILGVMFAIAAWVMVTKARLVRQIGQANDRFLHRFRADLSGESLKDARGLDGSTLYQLWRTGQAEIGKRFDAGRTELSGAALDAIKATMDAVQVRQNHHLNARMVLLTIAISGGPFLGLLGTVVGVMITFAAIAAAGDVNVNAIAPGIAAALLATVAGLGVAIPALFGYNWLAAQIKNISSDMQIFVDEFVTRAAEAHGQR